MAIPEYENAAKWAAFFRSLPLIQKVILIVIAVFIMGIILFFWLGPMRTLQNENLQLKTDLSEAQKEIATLRDKKDELHRENLYYKNMIEPLQKKAEELYPELEAAAALAKLSEDLETVRSLATRDVYKPLNQSQRDVLFTNLLEIRKRYTNPPKVVIAIEQGNSSRMRVGSDLKTFLDRAGFTTGQRPQQTFRTGVPPDVRITLNPTNLQFVQELATVIGQSYINKQFSGKKDEKFTKEEIEIEINGDPLFSETGMVTFR